MNTEEFSSLATHGTRPTILFVGDSSSFSEMYFRLIQSEFPDVQVTNVLNITDATNRVLANARDVCAIVVSCRSGRDTLMGLQSLISNAPTVRPVLAYQTMNEVHTALSALECRSFLERLSFLPLRARMDCTITILRLLLSGERHVSGEVLDMLMERQTPNTEPQGDNWALTNREKEVLVHLAKGASNKIIARALDLAESTVKLHIHHIIVKLGVSNRTEAAVAYVADAAGMPVAAVN